MESNHHGKDTPASNKNGKDIHHKEAKVQYETTVPLVPLAERPMLTVDDIQEDEMCSILPYSTRPAQPLAIEEDCNWLSRFQTYLRQEMMEVFIATDRDVEARSAAKRITPRQIGIRCRFCAHLHPSQRAVRSAAFPSGVKQIYQSFTMMLREHFTGQCHAIPPHVAGVLKKLHETSSQSASNSKRYWTYAAQRLGMVDSGEMGMQITEESRAAGLAMKPFDESPELNADLQLALERGPIVKSGEDEELFNMDNGLDDDDDENAEDWYTTIAQHSLMVHLAPSEKIGKRSCLRVGLPGLACQYCSQVGRTGLARIFIAKKRFLQSKLHHLGDHMMRCLLCPEDLRMKLKDLYHKERELARSTKTHKNRSVALFRSDKRSKEVFTTIWKRFGHTDDEKATVFATAPTNQSTATAIATTTQEEQPEEMSGAGVGDTN